MRVDQFVWANALNAICPYFTMFPLRFPLEVLRKGNPGLVVDPFCGRGTTNLAARLVGYPTVGIDSSPVAVAATAAKLTRGKVTPEQVRDLAADLISEQAQSNLPRGAFWKLAYHPEVLRDLCAIRSGLLRSCKSDSASALRATMLGALHGPKRKDGSSTYFSNQAPRTYAPKPRYAVGFWRRNDCRPPRVDVLEIIYRRARRAFDLALAPVKARVRCGDSRSIRWSQVLHGMGPIRWIVTSPPYYGLRTYRPDQWLREWFLGANPDVNYTADGQVRHASPKIFATDLREVWLSLSSQAADDARMVIRFGAINDRPIKPDIIIQDSIRDSGWRIQTIRPAGVASAGRRQASTFAENIRPAVTEIDVWCVRT